MHAWPLKQSSFHVTTYSNLKKAEIVASLLADKFIQCRMDSVQGTWYK